MTRKVRRFLWQLMPATLLCGFALGLVVMNAIQSATDKAWTTVVFDGRLMSGERPLDVASLREIVADAETHDQATAAVFTNGVPGDLFGNDKTTDETANTTVALEA